MHLSRCFSPRELRTGMGLLKDDIDRSGRELWARDSVSDSGVSSARCRPPPEWKHPDHAPFHAGREGMNGVADAELLRRADGQGISSGRCARRCAHANPADRFRPVGGERYGILGLGSVRGRRDLHCQLHRRRCPEGTNPGILPSYERLHPRGNRLNLGIRSKYYGAGARGRSAPRRRGWMARRGPARRCRRPCRDRAMSGRRAAPA